MPWDFLNVTALGFNKSNQVQNGSNIQRRLIREESRWTMNKRRSNRPSFFQYRCEFKTNSGVNAEAQRESVPPSLPLEQKICLYSVTDYIFSLCCTDADWTTTSSLSPLMKLFLWVLLSKLRVGKRASDICIFSILNYPSIQWSTHFFNFEKKKESPYSLELPESVWWFCLI